MANASTYIDGLREDIKQLRKGFDNLTKTTIDQRLRIKELEAQIKWILVAESIPSDRREVDTGFLNEKGVIERGFDRYNIKTGFGENVIYWKYQTEWPDQAAQEVEGEC